MEAKESNHLTKFFFFCIISLISFSVSAQESTVLFSTTPIDEANYNQDQLAEDFDVMDNLYVGVFMNNSLEHYYKQLNWEYDFADENQAYKDIDYRFNFPDIEQNYNFALRIFIDDELAARMLYEMAQDDMANRRALTFALATDNDKDKRKFSSTVNHWNNIVTDLEPGTYNIKIDMVPFNKIVTEQKLPVIAQGEFTLDIENEEQLTEFSNERTSELPEVTVINPEIEQQILDASENVINNSRPIKAYIVEADGDWNYVQDEFNNVKYRDIVATVAYEMENGTCFLNSARYMQEHQGGGNYSIMRYAEDADGYYDHAIPCSKVVLEDNE
jgi:hypothetical protein